MEKVAEVGGLERIIEIIVPDRFRLLFKKKDGTTTEAEWRHRSRSESWTEKMRKAAGEHARRGGVRNG